MCKQNLTPLKTMVEELVWQNMQNHFDCFCFPVIPLNPTNCLNVINILILNTPRDLNLKFSHVAVLIFVSDYAYWSGWTTVCLLPKFSCSVPLCLCLLCVHVFIYTISFTCLQECTLCCVCIVLTITVLIQLFGANKQLLTSVPHRYRKQRLAMDPSIPNNFIQC